MNLRRADLRGEGPDSPIDDRSWLSLHLAEIGAVLGLVGSWMVLVASGAASGIADALRENRILQTPAPLALIVVGLLAGGLCGLSILRNRRAERARRREELVDELTGLPDRRTLAPAYREAVQRAGIDGQVAIALIDLRDFKAVNQMFGRDDGDLVMASVAGRMRAQLSDDDVLLRVAGDEFAIVRTLSAGVDELDDLGLALLGALASSFEIRTYTVMVGANIGFAVTESAEEPLAAVMRRADVALYRSKLQGANRYEVHDHGLHDQVSPAVIVDWLRTALDGGQLRLLYQPIYSMSGDLVVAVEALLRWEHPTEGVLLPEVVLPALEDSGLIVEVGEWVINEACRQARVWADNTPQGMPPVVFVNTSPRQLMSSDFLSVLERAIATHGIDANQICLELGALASLPDNSQAWMLLRECKALGVRLALDNFGSNESSYGIIRRLHLDYIKLGRRLCSARGATPHDDAITTSVLSLARSLGYTTIAEGIEDPASLERARAFGCDLAQGFYFGVAEPASAIDRQIADGRTSLRATFH